MYSFNNDYSESAHPTILNALVAGGFEQNDGYGEDVHCANAINLIKQRIKRDDVDVHLLPGGTMTNKTFIAHVLKPYDAVVAATTGHINTHEAGAIEATGHKVLSVATSDGKLTKEMIAPIITEHDDEHMVCPAMVYVSNPTELGTIYSKAELTDLYQFCQDNSLILYIDGARLAMGLTARDNDLQIEDLPSLCDAFYIGGTKVGALFGEALVIVNDRYKKNLRISMKQQGGMSAKGWLLGLQFEHLFQDDLYLKLGKNANNMADQLSTCFEKHGYSFIAKQQTNQVFPILPNDVIAKLDQEYLTSTWAVIDDRHTAVRFVTSWATTQEAINRFVKSMDQI